jgi:hypothetical protein
MNPSSSLDGTRHCISTTRRIPKRAVVSLLLWRACRNVRFSNPISRLCWLNVVVEHSNSVLINWAKAQSVKNGKIIDVGGGRGHVAMELAEV